MNDLKHYRILLGVELALEQSATSIPAVLDKADSEQLLAHLSTDLLALIPALNRCSITGVGALYDQAQLLRSGFPVFTTLEKMHQASQTGVAFSPQLLAIGSHQKRLPNIQLQPDTDLPCGQFVTIPLVLSGNQDDIDTLGTELEHLLIEQGKVSAHSAQWLQTTLGCRVIHAQLMTLTDLLAMLQLQLQHIGHSELWYLLDSALSAGSHAEPETDLNSEQTTAQGNRFSYHDGAVDTTFYSLYDWINGGHSKLFTEQTPDQSYLAWLRTQRQYQQTLAAHDVKVRLSAPDGKQLDGEYWQRFSTVPGLEDNVLVEHSDKELGIIAISWIQSGQQTDYYPLQPSGIDSAYAAINELGAADRKLYPGRLCYNPANGQLTTD